MEQRISQIVEGALAVVAPVAFASRPVVVRPPRVDVLAVAPGTLQGTIFRPQRMDVGLTLFGIEELVDVREHRHRCASPVVRRSSRNCEEILTYVSSFYP